MDFLDKLKKSIEERVVPEWALRPEVLMLPQIPQPMHGLAPRVVLGNKWWDETRYAAYKSTGDCCVACGVHKSKARGPKHIEGHEVYRTDYSVGRIYYLETVPLCHFCHNYIHQGRLQALLEKHQITQQRFVAIIQHGDRVLAKAGLIRPNQYDGPMVEWSKWRLVLFGKMYKPRWKSAKHWAKHFEGMDE